MASKAEFLNGLRGYIDSLKKILQEVAGDISKRKEEFRGLEAERKQELHSLSQALLPDLNEATLVRLRGLLPGVVDPSEISRMRREKEDAVRQRMPAPSSDFSLEKYEKRKSELEDKAKLASIQYAEVLRTLNDSAPGMLELYRRGYNTPSYPFSFFSSDIFNYLADWKRADEIVELLHMQSWHEVSAFCAPLVEDMDRHRREQDEAARSLDGLEEDKKRFQNLLNELSKVDKAVLEMLQIKVRNIVDSLSDEQMNYPCFRSIIALNGKMAKCNGSNKELVEERKVLTEEIGKLERLYSSAEKSKEKSVPDKFLKFGKAKSSGRHSDRRSSRGSSPPLVARRYSPVIPTSGGHVTVVNHYQDNSLFDYMLYDSLFHHFDHHHHDDHRDSVRHTATLARSASNGSGYDNRNYGS